MKIKLLIGGSPCTYWSIANAKNREIIAEGQGWELFENYLIAKKKFKPDFFLYENNKSAAQPIKDQIGDMLGVPLMHINSALVSAQNRQRFYAFNASEGGIPQPEDRGIILGDIVHRNRREDEDKLYKRFETHGDHKSNALTTVQTDAIVTQPVRLGSIGKPSQGNRVYSPKGKSVSLLANGGGLGAKTGLYAFPIKSDEISDNGSKALPIYHVKDGKIIVKGKEYPIRLQDGTYIIRKLTPIECERLQTLPDNYTAGISDTQRYKVLGNGWTAEVIIHILSELLKDIPKETEIEVLSLYDGIGTGRYCLDKMGFHNIVYHAYEIDKYAIKIATKNYPDIIQHGNAFVIREDDWSL